MPLYPLNLDDVLRPAANWVLKLQEIKYEMEVTIAIMFTTADITIFQSSG